MCASSVHACHLEGDVDKLHALQAGELVASEPRGHIGRAVLLVAQRSAGDLGAVDDAEGVQRRVGAVDALGV